MSVLPQCSFRRWALPLAAVLAMEFFAGNVRAQAPGLPYSKGTVKENPKDGLKYAWIPPGTFMMGCSPGDSECHPDEKPPHRVTITKGFWMGQTVVTVRAYKRYAAATGRPMPNATDDNKGWAEEKRPMSLVKWNEAQAFCGWGGGRLPKEAEWEYAARAGSTAARYGDSDAIAWNYNNSNHSSHDVGLKPPNALGLYDMLGNIYEWVSDWYDAHYYQHSPAQDPQGPANGQEHAVRSVGWDEPAPFVRVSYRFHVPPAMASVSFGFRCAREANAP